jgi:hypothetical protein
MVEVLYTDEFEDWWDALSENEQEDVAVVVGLLEARGVGLGYPHSTAIQASKLALRELRIQSGGRPLRVFYAFDPWRQAALLIGGDKTGRDRFYEEMVPKAEKIFEQHLVEEAARRRKSDGKKE